MVAGVPHSSLYFNTADNSSSEYRSRVAHTDSTSSSTEDELGPRRAGWRYGHAQQKQEQEESCRSNRGARDAAAAAGTHASDAYTESSGRVQSHSASDQNDSVKNGSKQLQQQQAAVAHRPGSSASNTGGKAHQRGKLNGTKAGVGLFFVQNAGGGACIVDEIINGSAAHRDGRIMVRDILTSVDGVSVQHVDLSDVRKMIVGDPGTEVVLQVQRGDQRIIIRLVRSVPQPCDSSDTGVGICSSAKEPVPTPRAQANHNVPGKVSRDASSESAAREHAGNLPRTATSTPQGDVVRNDSHVSIHTCAEVEDRCRALCGFAAQRDHEISLEAGEMLIVTR